MIPGMMGGNNSMLNSVMNSRTGASGGSYAELSMNGRRVATNMREQQTGKNAVREMRVNARETEESIEEQVAATLQEKKATEKAQAEAEAQRISQTGQSGTTATNVSTQVDTVKISDAGQQAAQAVVLARTPVPAQASTPAPAADAPEQSGPQVSADAAPQAEQVDVTV